jgi:hypothetical protein
MYRTGTSIAFVVGGIALLIHRACYPPPVVIGKLASPDRKFELVIVETQPQGFMMQSPYLYDVSVVDRQGRPMTGIPLHIYNDSASLPASEFTADWSDQHVKLTWSGRFHALTDLSDGTQSWR